VVRPIDMEIAGGGGEKGKTLTYSTFVGGKRNPEILFGERGKRKTVVGFTVPAILTPNESGGNRGGGKDKA